MTTMKNGDMPAMPFTEYDGDGVIYHQHPGLTKRELFAAMAMQGIVSKSPHMLRLRDQESGFYEGPSPEQFGDRYAAVAKGAVGYADALLAALDASRPVEPKPKATGGGE